MKASLLRGPGPGVIGRAVALCLAVVAVALYAPTAPTASAQTAGGADPSMRLMERSPWVGPDQTIDLDITTERAEAATLQVVVRSPVDSVEDLERSLDEGVGRILHRSPPLAVGFVPTRADGSRRVSIPTSTTDGDEFTAQLAQPGVYQVVVTLSDETGVVDEIRTPVVRLGTTDDPLAAPNLEVITDLSVPPTIEADGRRELDDSELARLDRLGSILDGSALGSPMDATISMSPDTLDALTASSDPRAATILEAVTTVEEGRTVLGLPTVPLSAPAMVDAGLEQSLVTLLEGGRSTLEDRTEAVVDTTVWPAEDGIDQASARVLAGAGASHLLLGVRDAAAESPATERRLLDAGPVSMAGIAPLDALLVDQATTQTLLTRAADRADAGHIALADLLVRDDGEQSRIVLEVDDVPDDSLLLPLLRLLSAPGSPVALGPLTTDDAAPEPDEEPDDDGVPIIDELALPEATIDLAGIAEGVRETATAVESFASLVGPESARASALDLRIATSVSSATDETERDDLLESVEREVDAAFDAITLGGQTALNLTSRSGTLPLRIHNGNDFPVEVVLEVSSDRLRFPSGHRFDVPVTEEVTRFDIPVRAQATGSVPTFVQITSPDGRITLDERRLDVRSTAVSGVGLALSLGALAVLVIWWARTWHRNRNGSRSTPEENLPTMP